MGRPIKKIWFTLKDGSVAGDLTVTTASGDEVIEAQKGTGKYLVASGIVKLVDKTTGLTGNEASLQHEGKTVRKIAQYRLYYFDGTSAVWRDREANVIGTFIPALTPEGGVVPSQATASITVADGAVDSIAVLTQGAGYGSAPTVTISNPNGTDAVLGTVTLSGDAIDSIAITDGGSGYVSAPVITITGDGSGEDIVAVLTNGVITGFTINNGGTGFSSATASAAAVSKVQATATAVLTADKVTSLTLDNAGEGYVSAGTVITIAAP